MLRAKIASLCLLAFGIGLAGPAQAQDCANRGTLDARYCDANRDLLADTPTDAAKQKDPDTLIFSYTPVEDPSVYENVFADFLAHLSKVTGKKIKWFGAESYAAQVEAMRSGRLHIAGVASGPTPFAVNLAGFVPIVGSYAVVGDEDAEPRVAKLVGIGAEGIVELEVLPGSVASHAALLAPS